MAKRAYIGANNIARKTSKGYIGIYQDAINNTHGLPKGYTELEYIESSGSQYIDVGFCPNQDTKTILDMQGIGAYADTNGGQYFGCYSGNWTNCFCFSEQSYGNSAISFYYGASSVVVGSFTQDSYTVRRTVVQDKNTFTIDGTTYTAAASTFSVPYSMVLFGSNANGVLQNGSQMRVYSCQIYDNGTLVRDFVPCINPIGEIGMYDLAGGIFYGNVGSGSFTAGNKVVDYPSGNYAHRIKKAYIGIGGVARPCWSGGELAYYGTLPSLSEAKYQAATVNVGRYGLVGCGRDGTYNVDAYDVSLTHSLAPNSGLKMHWGATNAGAYALMHNYGTDSTWSNEINAYDENLTAQLTLSLTGTIRGYTGAASTGNYGLFAGGAHGQGTWYGVNDVNVFDTDLTVSNVIGLSSSKYYVEGHAFKGKAVFAGGYNASNRTDYLDIDVYDESLTKTSVTSLNSAKNGYFQVVVVGRYLLYSLISGSVDVYDTDFVKTTAPSLSVARTAGAFTTLDGFALYAGGQSGSVMYNTVDVYDESLTRTAGTSLRAARCRQSPLTIGNFALLCGGYAPTVDSNLEAFTLV